MSWWKGLHIGPPGVAAAEMKHFTDSAGNYIVQINHPNGATEYNIHHRDGGRTDETYLGDEAEIAVYDRNGRK